MTTEKGKSRFHRPRTTPLFFVGVAVTVIGLAALFIGFTSPSTRIAQSTAYVSTGTFAYTGRPNPPDPAVYPDGVARTGMPLFLDSIRNTTFRFAYRFQSSLPHVIKG